MSKMKFLDPKEAEKFKNKSGMCSVGHRVCITETCNTQKQVSVSGALFRILQLFVNTFKNFNSNLIWRKTISRIFLNLENSITETSFGPNWYGSSPHYYGEYTSNRVWIVETTWPGLGWTPTLINWIWEKIVQKWKKKRKGNGKETRNWCYGSVSGPPEADP